MNQPLSLFTTLSVVPSATLSDTDSTHPQLIPHSAYHPCHRLHG